jgi:hypothetical protein
MMYHVQMASCGLIFLPSFMKIGKCFRAIIRFGLSNMNDCNVGIIEGKKLRSAPLR